MRMKRVFAAGALLAGADAEFRCGAGIPTLPEIREQAKDGWHETYTDKYGRETVVDIDVEVYGGENAPRAQDEAGVVCGSAGLDAGARKDGTSMGKSSSGIKIRRILCSAEGVARSR